MIPFYSLIWDFINLPKVISPSLKFHPYIKVKANTADAAVANVYHLNRLVGSNKMFQVFEQSH